MFEFLKKYKKEITLILPLEKQIKAWHKANRKMRWGIAKYEFENIEKQSFMTDSMIRDGFAGILLCYGFGDDGSGNADAVLSGKLAWEYAVRKWDVKVWQCRYIDFDRKENIRLRPSAPPRPKGFYRVGFNPGEPVRGQTVDRFRKGLIKSTGCGPEGIQLLTVTHPHLTRLMNRRQLPFMAFADYDVAPHGFFDFYDAVQMFCSQDTLGLGIGNIDNYYPGFTACEIRFEDQSAQG